MGRRDKEAYKLVLYAIRHTPKGQKGRKLKLISQSNNQDEVLAEYFKLLGTNDPFFPKKVNYKGEFIHFELTVLSKDDPTPDIVYDERSQVAHRIKSKTNDGYSVFKTSVYQVEESFKHWNSQKMLNFSEIAKKFFVVLSGNRVVTLLNNKIIIEDDSVDAMDMLIFQNLDESFRMFEYLYEYCVSIGIGFKVNFVDEPTRVKKSKFYDKVVDKLGVKRNYLQKVSTR